MCQLARPTGVVARGVAIAWETGTAVSVKAATTSGHGASAIAKDARLTIWRERPKRRNQRSPEPRAIRTGRHQLQMRHPVCCCSKCYQRKLFAGGIAAGEHSAAATEHREEVLLLRCRRRRARSRNRGSRALLLLQYSAGGMSAGPARPSLQRAGWLLQSTMLLLRSAVKQRSRSSAQRPRGPSLATKRRLLQSSAEEHARTIPQLRLHPRLGTKKD